MKELVRKIEAEIAKYRLTFGDEKQLQGQLIEIFARGGIVAESEVRISARERLDFLVPSEKMAGGL